MVLKIFEMPLSYFESTLLEDLNKLLSLRAGLWAPGQSLYFTIFVFERCHDSKLKNAARISLIGP